MTDSVKRYKMFTETRGDVEVVLAADYVRDVGELQRKIAELEQYIAEQEGRNNESLEQPSMLKIVPSTASDGTV